ncbi:MAG: DUF4091 domain-containing protein [Verrucomicrobia bacterium]|nr:DUF4091 domain-containing protein [Verrucomicrobiota bacterium]
MTVRTRAICLILWTVAMAAVAADVSDDVVGWWKFDALDEKDYLLADATGRATGALQAQDIGQKANFLKKGLFGSGGLFNRGKWRVVVKHHEHLSLTDDFSIECVIKPFDCTSYRTILWKGSRKVQPPAINYYLGLRNGRVEFKWMSKEGQWRACVTRHIEIKPQYWYHLLVRHSGGKTEVFVNGRQDEVASPADVRGEAAALWPNSFDLIFGEGAMTGGGSGYSFDGLIDEIKITRGQVAPLSETRRTDLFLRMNREQCETLSSRHAALSKRVRELSVLLPETDGKDVQAEAERRLAELEKLHKQQQGRFFVRDSAQTAAQSAQEAERQHEELDRHLAAFEDAKAQLLHLLESQVERSRYGRSFAGGKAFAVTTLPDCQRLVKKKCFINDLSALRDEISLSAAGNERESFQIYLIGHPQNSCKDIRVELSDLRHERGTAIIPKRNLEWGVVECIETEPPDILVDFVGPVPDVIFDDRETAEVAAGDFTPIHVRIFVPPKTPPGRYTGTVRLMAGNFTKAVAVHLTVFGFDLPAKNSLKIGFNFSEEQRYKRWYGLQQIEERRSLAIYEFLQKYRIPPTDKYSGLDIYPKPEFLGTLREGGLDFVSLKYFNAQKPVTDADIEKAVAYYRDIVAQLKALGCFDAAYLHSYDELAVHRYLYDLGNVSKVMRRFRHEFPDLKFIQSSYPVKDLADLDVWNVWMIPFNYFATERAGIEAEARKPGREIWWYVADGAPPFPGFNLDCPLFDCRVIMTLSYKYKVAGINYWCINREWTTNESEKVRWPQTRWKPYFLNINTGKRNLKNGEGNFVYPGPDGRLYASLRLENIRDGIEDYEYFVLLKKKLASYCKSPHPDPARIRKIEALLAIPNDVAAAINDYSLDPSRLLRLREEVARAIETLAQ